MQMYKVFVNDCAIILTEDQKIETPLNKMSFKDLSIVDLIKKIKLSEINGVVLICDDLNADWLSFQSYFEIEIAAGGKVSNLKNEVLFIFRYNKWDLPKGKLEKGESIERAAIREVEEECGVGELEIKRKLATTYHVYEGNSKLILKITYWFLMHTKYTGELAPQQEEGITAACFKNEEETTNALNNSYENIRLLF